MLVSQIFEGFLNAKITHEEDETWDCMTCDLTSEAYPYISPSPNLLSNPYDYFVLTFAIASGDPYSDFERMFVMFDDETWIAIAITLTVGLVVTLGLNFVSEQVRNFVVGQGVSNPTVNLVAIFLTGGQVRSPQRNFARFIFVLFVVWSMIIRTCHQSMFFQLLQADLRNQKTKPKQHDSFQRRYCNVGWHIFLGTFEHDFDQVNLYIKNFSLPQIHLNLHELGIHPRSV